MDLNASILTHGVKRRTPGIYKGCSNPQKGECCRLWEDEVDLYGQLHHDKEMPGCLKASFSKMRGNVTNSTI
jgi:hypothetical protein